MGSWLAEAECFGGVAEATESGLLAAVARAGASEAAVAGVAATLGVGEPETARRCDVLAAGGILRREGPRVRLASDVAALVDAGAMQPLGDVVGTVRAKLAALARCADTVHRYTALGEADRVAVARNAGAMTPQLVAATAAVLAEIAELGAAWSGPARHVELGCGAGCQLLSPLVGRPHLTAVGVELSPAVAGEAQRRAGALGVADRVEVRVGDAGELPDAIGFDTAYWSQPFFPTSSRAAAPWEA